MMMFTNKRNAAWIGSQILARDGFGLAAISFPVNRNAFRLEAGDLFKFSYSPYNISNMVCRIIKIREEDLETENIIIDAAEDINYISSSVTLLPSSGKAVTPDYTLTPLTHATVVETPYIISGGGPLAVIPLAAREKGLELGYLLYMSVDDGASYNQIAIIPTYNPFGTLASNYPASTYTIDDDLGFQIDFTNDDVNIIQTITRTQLCGGTNLALLGNEIISFQTITPVSNSRYVLTGIYRGRFDTEKIDHLAGEDFFFIGLNNFRSTKDTEIISGTSRKFKLVPYSSKYSDEIANASEIPLTINGRGKTPYKSANLEAGKKLAEENPTYTDDIVLNWDPRLRGDGAGIGSEVFDINYAPVADSASGYEGYFRIKIYVGGNLVRTTDSIADFTWTYTSAMNIADNGSLPNEVVLMVSNYRNESGYEYESDPAEIIVTLE